MATVCTNCGQELPRDDAHFCNSCGTLVPSHPFSSQSLAASNSASQKAAQQEREKPVLREQRVQQPSAQPIAQEAIVSQAQRPPRTTRRIAPDDLPKSAIAWPAPLTHVSVKELQVQKAVAPVEPSANQVMQNVESRPAPAPARELHVKVWEQERGNPPTPLPEQQEEELQDSIEDTPTSSLITAESVNVEDAPTIIQAKDKDNNVDAVEHLDTVPMPNYLQTKTPSSPQSPIVSPHSLHGNTPLPNEQRIREQRAQPYTTNTPQPVSYPISSQPIAPIAPPAPARFSQPMSANTSQNQPQQSVHTQARHVSGVPLPSPALARRQKSRVPFILLLACLCILILGGGVWILLANPFAVPSVTQPLQSFKDAQLSVSLPYPSGWTTQKNATGVVLADSSHTAQVKLSAITTSGDAAAYVQQQATKSGMTAVKSLGAVSFAGTSWQQVQGNMQQDGVNYTMHMFATLHANRMYVLTQMAPQNVYADEESVVFSPIRNSFAFM